MKTLLKWIVVLAALGGIGFAAYGPTMRYIEERNKIEYRTQPATLGDVTLVVNATGEVKPVQRVSIGSVVSGPILSVKVDFNQKVNKGDLLAEIDPQLYKASEARDRAILQTRQAEVMRAEARYQQAVNAEKRAMELMKVDETFISVNELDELKFNKLALEQDLVVAKTNVQQAQANLENSITNLSYTKIEAPVSGMIIDRKVDSGQTLAAQFQTPEMFVIAPRLDEEVHIYASVDEADIGLIRKAQTEGQPVRFTVDAYPDELFDSGKILEVRYASTVDQNVVTYPVVVSTPNPEIKLLPGMTANLSFQIDQRKNVMKIPNAALRFYPNRLRVRPEDRPILDGVNQESGENENAVQNQSASEKFEVNSQRNTRHVWVQDGKFLKAVKVTIGISDSRFTQMVSGELKENDALVIGEKPKE